MAEDALCLQEDAETPLSLKAGGELGAGSTAVQIKDVGFRYDAALPLLFRNAEMGIDSQSRIVLLGENGQAGARLSTGCRVRLSMARGYSELSRSSDRR